MTEYKRYIGDGAYADFDGYAVVLTTEDGISVQNRVVLEPSVLKDFEIYLTWLRAAIAKASPPDEMDDGVDSAKVSQNERLTEDMINERGGA